MRHAHLPTHPVDPALSPEQPSSHTLRPVAAAQARDQEESRWRKRSFAALFILLAGFWASSLPSAMAASTSLVINEVDYIQLANSDMAEFIEIKNIGAEPVNLASFWLVAIDGGGTQYRRQRLLNVDLLPRQYFVVCGNAFQVPNCDQAIESEAHILRDGQSGQSPNAVGLVFSPGGNPQEDKHIDSVSYEGDVKGAAGAGGDWTETQGVDPGEDPGVDHQGISRAPDGTDSDNNAQDFKPLCITPGAKNSDKAGGCAPAKKIDGLVINEVDYIQSNEDAAEFVEIYNSGQEPIDLGRYVLLSINNQSAVYRRAPLPPFILPSGGFYVICGTSRSVPRCDFVIDEPTNIWHDDRSLGSPNAIAISKEGGDPTCPRNPDCLDMLVDSVTYDGNLEGGPRAGGSWTETDGVTNADNTDKDFLGISRTPNGSDTDNNKGDLGSRCITPGQLNSSQANDCAPPDFPLSLVINEIDYTQPNGPDSAEFVEIKNVGSQAIQMDQYELLGVNDKGGTYLQVTLDTHVLDPGGYFVVCNPSGKTPNCDQTAGAKTDNWLDPYITETTGAAIALMRNPTIDPFDDILVDTVSHDGSVAGGPVTGGLWTEETGVDPGDPNRDENVGLSRLPDGSDSDVNKDDFIRGCSTPGYINRRVLPIIPCNPPTVLTPMPSATFTRTPSPTATSRIPTETATATGPIQPTPTPDESGNRVYIVNDNGHLPDLVPDDGVCAARGARCTLRAALEESNASTDSTPIKIQFSVTTGPIVVPGGTGGLPTLLRGRVTIDGVPVGAIAGAEDQDHASLLATSDVQTCSAGQLLRGSGSGSGLSIDAREVTVVGMRITAFETGISVIGKGTDARLGSNGDGLRDDAECNAIWGNSGAQVRLAGTSVSNNRVSGNFIGSDADGTPDPAPRVADGVKIVAGASNNIIGAGQNGAGERVGRGNRIIASRFGVHVQGAAASNNEINGNRIGARSADKWDEAANAVGVRIEGAMGTIVGGPYDQDDDKIAPGLSNAIGYNLHYGVEIDSDARNSSLRGNEIWANRRDGIRLGRTANANNSMRSNRIWSNGGEAIAVGRRGAELPPPSIDWINPDPLDGQMGGRGCAGCIVEIFFDLADEAKIPVPPRAQVLLDGTWSLQFDPLKLESGNLSATQTTASGSTSRLSRPKPLGSQWRLIEIPPRIPRVLRPGEPVLERVYRLYDHKGNPAAGAKVRFTPLDLVFPSNNKGLIRLEISLAAALAWDNDVMSFTMEAVDQDGKYHPVLWHPHLVMGARMPAVLPGDLIMDLSGVGPDGIGGLLSKTTNPIAHALMDVARLDFGSDTDLMLGLDLHRWLGRDAKQAVQRASNSKIPRVLQGESNGYGAAFAASPSVSLREGDYAWQENLAHGGGIYELNAGETTMSGELEITAPVEAFNPSGPASGCTVEPQGATIAGWSRDEICWVPIPGTETDGAGAGETTFGASAEITVEPASGFALEIAGQLERTRGMSTRLRTRDLIGAGRTKLLQATGTITLYTVGFDVTAPVITPTVGSGAVLSSVPSVVAHATDIEAGIQQSSGITLKLDGIEIPVSYHAPSGEIRVAPENRAIAAGAARSAQLEITVLDGFCNQGTSTTTVTLDANAAPTATPRPSGGAGRILYIPYLRQTQSR